MKTRCPVSAAASAISSDSRSRISPTRIAFGACRKAERRPSRERAKILSHLALAHHRLLLAIEKLDRILQRHDVNLLAVIQLIDHRRERRRLADPGTAGHQNDPGFLPHHLAEDRRHPEFIETGHLGRELPHHDGTLAVLLENIHPKPGHLRHRVAAITRASRSQIGDQALIPIHDHIRDLIDRLLIERRIRRIHRDIDQAPMRLHQRRPPRHEEQIRNPLHALQHRSKQAIDSILGHNA